MYPVTLRLILFKNVKGSMEISMYPVTLRLILFKNVLPKGSMEISMYPVILTNIIQKCFTQRVHGNFNVPSNIETNSKIFLLKGSMEISIYPVILRPTQKNYVRKGSMKMSVYPVTSRLIQKFVTERVHGNFHVSCHIEFNLKKILPKGSMEFSLYL